MSLTVAFAQQTVTQLAPLARELPRWIGLVALLVVFRPLLLGLLRASVLVVCPKLSRDELRRRAHMRDVALVERIIASSGSPSDAAELRAMAGRD